MKFLVFLVIVLSLLVISLFSPFRSAQAGSGCTEIFQKEATRSELELYTRDYAKLVDRGVDLTLLKTLHRKKISSRVERVIVAQLSAFDLIHPSAFVEISTNNELKGDRLPHRVRVAFAYMIRLHGGDALLEAYHEHVKTLSSTPSSILSTLYELIRSRQARPIEMETSSRTISHIVTRHTSEITELMIAVGAGTLFQSETYRDLMSERVVGLRGSLIPHVEELSNVGLAALYCSVRSGRGNPEALARAEMAEKGTIDIVTLIQLWRLKQQGVLESDLGGNKTQSLSFEWMWVQAQAVAQRETHLSELYGALLP